MSEPVPAIAVTRKEAAERLRMSLSFFKQHVQPDLKVFRLRGVVRIPVAELERYVAERSERVLGDLDCDGAKSPREAGTSGGRRRAKKTQSRRGEDTNDG